MRPKINVAALAKPAAREHCLRFIFGGVVSVFTGVVAHRYGPEIGGLFLAFPAILPASLTLVQQHDGRRQAIADARGGRLGALALVVFALVTRACAVRQYGPVVTLGIATCAWCVSAIGLWVFFHGSWVMWSRRGDQWM